MHASKVDTLFSCSVLMPGLTFAGWWRWRRRGRPRSSTSSRRQRRWRRWRASAYPNVGSWRRHRGSRPDAVSQRMDVAADPLAAAGCQISQCVQQACRGSAAVLQFNWTLSWLQEISKCVRQPSAGSFGVLHFRCNISLASKKDGLYNAEGLGERRLNPSSCLKRLHPGVKITSYQGA